ncbi:MAG: hypothetical protein JXM70_16890 [Pirellulales bacterium]|nr:hypothetical protein [Pirellulales bacterium]
MPSRLLSRRRFICTSALVTVVTILDACGASLLASEPAGKPLFRFMQWNDTHVEARQPNDYPRANERFEYLVESLGKATDDSVPDFIIGVGDLVHGMGGLSTITPDFKRLKDLTGVVKHAGFYQIVISGTASYPSDFATYDVFPDRIHVQMHSLPKSLLDPSTNIHGKRRHGIDYTDATHRTHEAYLRGNAEERMFDIALIGKKRIPKP